MDLPVSRRRLRGNQSSSTQQPEPSGDPLEGLEFSVPEHLQYSHSLANFMGRSVGYMTRSGLTHKLHTGRPPIVGLGTSFRTLAVPVATSLGLGNAGESVAKFPGGAEDVSDWNKRLAALERELSVLTHPPVTVHPNIVHLKELAWQDVRYPHGLYYPGVVVEKAHFGTLMDFQQPDSFNLRFGPKLSICLDLATALQFLHECGIIHGDIKPDNVLLFVDESSPFGIRAKLSDFSHAIFTKDAVDGMVAWNGFTYEWAAPEVLISPGYQADEVYRSDIFSFGLLFCHVLLEAADGLPFHRIRGDDPDESVLDLAIGTTHEDSKDFDLDVVEEVLNMTLPFDPTLRVASMTQVSRALRSALLKVLSSPGPGDEIDSTIFQQVPALPQEVAERPSEAEIFDVNEACIALSILPKGVQRQLRDGILAKLYGGLPKDAFAGAVLQLCVCDINGFGKPQNIKNGLSLLAKAAQMGDHRAPAIFLRLHNACNVPLPESEDLESIGVTFMPEYCALGGASSLSLIALADTLGTELETQALDAYRTSISTLSGLGISQMSAEYALDEPDLLKSQIQAAGSSDQLRAMKHVNKGGNTIFHIAAACGKIEAVKVLLALGFAIDITNLDGDTPLLCAMRNLELEVSLLLLSKGANPVHQTKRGCTPLHYLGSFQAVQLDRLMAVLGKDIVNVDPDCLDYQSVPWHYYCQLTVGTPLLWSINQQNLKAARYLLELGANPLFKNGRDCTPLTYIFSGCLLPFLELFTQEGSVWATQVKAEISSNAELYAEHIMEEEDFHLMLIQGESFKHARTSMIECLRLLLAPTDISKHLMWHAANRGRYDVVSSLLEADGSLVDCMKMSPPETCLARAIQHGDRALFELLLKYRPDITIRHTISAFSYLHLICIKGHTEDEVVYFAEALIKYGADIHVLDEHNLTPFWFALLTGHLPAAKVLLSHGASWAGTDSRGQSLIGSLIANASVPIPEIYDFLYEEIDIDLFTLFIANDSTSESVLHLAAERGSLGDAPQTKTLQLGLLDLFSHRFFLNHRDASGNTALHAAVASGNPTMLRLLLEAGADKNIPNNAELTPLEAALERPFSLSREKLSLSFEGNGAGRGAASLFDRNTAEMIELLTAEIKITAAPSEDEEEFGRLFEAVVAMMNTSPGEDERPASETGDSELNDPVALVLRPAMNTSPPP